MNVLIAEDESGPRRLLQRHLERWGYHVVATTSGTEAWQQFQAQTFPLVISDWEMPGLDGLELIRRIRAHPVPGYVYIILLTAKSATVDIVMGMEAGADDFVNKSFDWDELRVRLRAGERVVQLERALWEQNRILQETQAALIQSEKLASLGQLAAGIAHEINNPLAYAMNNLAVLQRDTQSILELLNRYRHVIGHVSQVPPQNRDDIARFESQIDLPYIQENLGRDFESTRHGLERVRDIVANLRDFARLDEAEFKAIDVTEALLSTIEIASYELKRHEIELETDFETLPPIQCHPSKLNQVFLNILMNAIQASPPSGTIAVRTRVLPHKRVEITIEDHGKGIHPDHLPHLFEPFFTTKPLGKGMGLGLSVSYGIVRDHGGVIEVESKPEQMTRFRVRLPLQPPPVSDEAIS